MMDLNFGRCQIYKLNISTCLTDREQDYYNLFCDGLSQKKLKERLGCKVSYTTLMVANEFHISEEQANVLLESQLNKQNFKGYLQDEIKNFPTDAIRKIRLSAIYQSDNGGNITDIKRTDNRIVWFENECVRRCNTNLDDVPLLDQFLILKCGSETLTGVLEQVIERGVDLDGSHYVFYTSSTGQMKDAEITLFKEDYWRENQYPLMCGLTEERINSMGGINMGKFFAAKALNISNSAVIDTDISIDDVIIVPDFKTNVKGNINFLDIETLEISQQEKEIEIEHMDGAGIFLPGVFPCSCQIRGGWLKGAVFPFDFHKFINHFQDKLADKHLMDAWGDPLTIDDFLNAKLILTDSQLKMRKYYESLNEYRDCFKKSEQRITINNCAHAPKDEVRVAYQPFQTIPRENLTYEAIENVTRKTIEYINDAKKNPNVVLKLMGIEIDEKDTDFDKKLQPLYAAIKKYPQMLNDIYIQKVMKSKLLSVRKQAKGCKLFLDGTWSYICPDLYALCEWLFLGEDTPDGLVPEGYVYSHYYDDKDIEETCCLRYPHLSDCEHGIRKVLQSSECKDWFIGFDTIVSSHDLISKAIQADWDGDHICLVHDKSFLDLLDRDKYPLYYDMTKAEPASISYEAIMTCLTSSFFGNENIGYVSNSITKIFNSKEDPDIKLVRILCAFNNYVIDFFKTQKSMDLKEYTASYNYYKDRNCKCPWFFMYAKDKDKKLCDPYNPDSNCDKISKYISSSTSEGISKIDYSTKDIFVPEMLTNKKITVNRQSEDYSNLRSLIKELKKEDLKLFKAVKANLKEVKTNLDFEESDQQIFYIYCRKRIKDIIKDRKMAANYFVDIEYYTEENKDDKKDILWNCFGDILYNNLCFNVDNSITFSAKRDRYTSSNEKEKAILKSLEEVKREQEELKKIPITQAVYDYLMDIKTRANRINDKYVMFVLYVFYERFKKKYDPKAEYVRIYKRQAEKITCAAIDKLIGIPCTKKALEQLQKKGYIRIEICVKYDKVYLLNLPDDSESKVIFTVESSNPLLDLWEYNGDRKIKKCEICERKFIATGNSKTCSEKCSRQLTLKNKNQ